MYVDPHEEFEAEFYVFPPFILIVTVISVCAVFVKPPGLFEEYQGYVVVSTSIDPVGLEFFQCMGCNCGVYIGRRPGAGFCTSFPFSVFA